jgi:alpha-L-fucosidase
MRPNIHILFLVFCTAVFMPASLSFADPKGAEMEDYEWWRAAKFGIFIHWNMSSILDLKAGSWYRDNSNKTKAGNKTTPGQLPEAIADGSYLEYRGKKPVPQEIYDNLYQIFNPVRFDAEAWVETFKAAGAKYIVFTAKHHDGFCMFDSKYTDYNIMNTPFGRDVAKELSEACAEAGIKVMWYYSKADWYDPRYDIDNPMPYQEYLINQIHELFGNYKNIQGIWWDGGEIYVDPIPVREAINQYNPHAISNGRGPKGMPGITFGTPEQKLGNFDKSRPWETCAIMQGEGWFWNGGKNIKSVRTCLRLLIDSAIGDGNLLLDFGPTAEGIIYEPIRKTYLGMGKWLEKYGESIYGTRGGPYMPSHWGGSTYKENTVYLHVTQQWPKGKLVLPALPARIMNVSALTGGEPVCTWNDSAITITLDPEYHQRVDTIIKLELDSAASVIEPIAPAEEPIPCSLNAAASASSTQGEMLPGAVTLQGFEIGMVQDSYFGEESGPVKKKKYRNPPKHKATREELAEYPWVKHHRGHVWRFWMADPADAQPWIEVDMGEVKQVDRISVSEKYNRIQSYELQYHDGKKWKTCATGGELGIISVELAQPVRARKVRLQINQWTSDLPDEGPAIHAIDVFSSP